MAFQLKTATFRIYNCEIPESRPNAKNYGVLMTTLNNSKQDITLDLSQPFIVKKFQESDILECALNKLL